MATLDDAALSQARNIEQATGRSIDAWVALARASGKERHSEILAWLKPEHGFSHGNANFVALRAKRGSVVGGDADLVDAMYAGPKSALRPFHEQVIELLRGFGDDVELAPKQAYVSLRRSKQFATVGPGSRGRLEIGLNLEGVEPAGRLEAAGGMCTHRLRLASTAELDSEVVGWLRQAYERAMTIDTEDTPEHRILPGWQVYVWILAISLPAAIHLRLGGSRSPSPGRGRPDVCPRSVRSDRHVQPGDTYRFRRRGRGVDWLGGGQPVPTEVGFANFAIGILGFACFWRYDFWLPAVIAKVVFAWGAGLTHVLDIVGTGNLASNNSGPILAWDFLLPVVAVALYLLARPARDRVVITPTLYWSTRWRLEADYELT